MRSVRQQTILELKFTGTSSEATNMIQGWPTESQKKDTDIEKTVQIGNDNPTFIIPAGAYIKWSKNLGGIWYIRNEKKTKVLGLPAISGKKLVRVDILNVADANYETDRLTAITDAEGNTVSETTLMKVKGYTYSFDTFAKSENGKVYYIASAPTASGWNGFADVTLYYE